MKSRIEMNGIGNEVLLFETDFDSAHGVEQVGRGGAASH